LSANDAITALLEDSVGALWIGHTTGLLVATPESAAAAGDGGPLATRVVFELESRPGARITDVERAPYSTTSLLQSSDGHIWVGTGGGLVVIDQGRIRRYTKSNGLPANGITTIAEDRDGNIRGGTS